jgi:hypothetical protein
MYYVISITLCVDHHRCHHHYHELSSWHIPATRIKTLRSMFLSEVPGNFYTSVYIVRRATGSGSEEFCLNFLLVLFDILLSFTDICYSHFFSNISITFMIQYYVACYRFKETNFSVLLSTSTIRTGALLQ